LNLGYCVIAVAASRGHIDGGRHTARERIVLLREASTEREERKRAGRETERALAATH
jgi:hypothetical protein